MQVVLMCRACYQLHHPAAAQLACIAQLIDRRYGGRIAKRYLTELRVARLRAR